MPSSSAEHTIAAGASITAEPVDLRGFNTFGLILPTGFQGTTISFLVSGENKGTATASGAVPLHADAGGEVTATVAADQGCAFDTISQELAPWRFVWIRSGTASSPQVQSAARSLAWFCEG